MNELGDNKPEKKMVTISTTDAEKEKANNVTPKKKAANNSTAATAAASTETATEQTAPNILVYKKVRERGLDSKWFKCISYDPFRWKQSWRRCRPRTVAWWCER